MNKQSKVTDIKLLMAPIYSANKKKKKREIQTTRLYLISQTLSFGQFFMEYFRVGSMNNSCLLPQEKKSIFKDILEI